VVEATSSALLKLNFEVTVLAESGKLFHNFIPVYLKLFKPKLFSLRTV
jgi:hypothetical protein